MKTITGLLLAASVLVQMDAQQSKIVVTQDKDGKITMTNLPVYTPSKGKLSYVKPQPTPSVPQVYLDKIRNLAYKYQLREDLIVAVAKAESSFNPFAVSKKGASGIMQLMKDTALQYGVKNIFNVDENLEAGVKHLKYLSNKYAQNLPLTLAAYNAGEEAVRRYNGVPPYNETQTYIRRVLKYMGMGYSGFFGTIKKSKIYKYITQDGKIVISDTLPARSLDKIQIIE